MSFLEPLFLAGLLAMGIPIAIHLINRRKATRQAFPALRLLMESNKKEARSIKVRQWLLLSLRVAVVAALAFALAKPYVLSEQGVTASERLPTAVVFVVDDSASMHYGDWWDNAKARFDDQMGKLRPWDEAALITTSDLDGPVTHFSSNHSKVDDAFNKLAPTEQSTDLSKAVVAAKDLLSASQLPSKRIVVISDFARGGFPAHPHPQSKVPYELRRVSVRDDPDGVPANLGVTKVDYKQEQSAKGGEWKITATVKNWGAQDQKGVQLRLKIDGQDIATGLVDVPAKKSSTYTFSHRFQGTGVRQGEVDLVDGDKLDTDNHYYFAVDLKERIHVLLVNGEPSSVPYADELFFLSRALNPGMASKSTIVPEMTTGEGLPKRKLDGFDVVVLANVTSVSPSEASKLEHFVDGGGGLFVTMGDQVDADSWNKTMGGLLPKPLRGMKQLAKRDDPDAPVKITKFGPGDRTHPIFRIFDMPGGATLQSVAVYSYMLLEPTQANKSREVLSYKDNAPALIERKVGDGRVMLLTTSVDREWTDLPVRTVFLPLMQRTVQYLARRATSAGKERPVVGKRVSLEVSGLVDERAIIHGPKKTRLVLEPADGTVGFTPAKTGFYQVWADTDKVESDASHPRNRLDALAFAVNASPAESQLAPLGPDALDPWTKAAAKPGEPGAAANTPTNERRKNIWPPILFAITMMMLLETLLGTRRSVLAKVWRRLTFQKDPEIDV